MAGKFYTILAAKDKVSYIVDKPPTGTFNTPVLRILTLIHTSANNRAIIYFFIHQTGSNVS